MNRVLSWPDTPIVPGLLDSLMKVRCETVVTDRCTIQFDLPLGPFEMHFLVPAEELEPGTRVYVWWKGGGFVCTPVTEFKAEARQSRLISREVKAARARLETARQERAARDSVLSDFDQLPTPPAAEHPLLQPRG